MPLILRGARQVGKSWLANRLAKHFPHFIELNFDADEEACRLFTGNPDINHLLEKLSLYAGKKIEPGKTLLFLDEIQECPAALKMLRYFKEKCPELHVTAAGSLLDFLLEKIGIPVGRVQFLYCYPLSFGEFLTVSGRSDLREYIKSKEIDRVIHLQLLELLKTYMWLGGMPAVVDA
jgi:predicted AAA+ superfamily ATPase